MASTDKHEYQGSQILVSKALRRLEYGKAGRLAPLRVIEIILKMSFQPYMHLFYGSFWTKLRL
jgi:hypothetical protein